MKKRVALVSLPLIWEEQHVNHIKWGCVTVVSSKSGEKINLTFPDFDVMILFFKWWDLKVHSKQDHKNNIISSECQRGRGLRAIMGLRSGNKGKDAFVVVSYDFEYITEEGKEVIFLPIFQPFPHISPRCGWKRGRFYCSCPKPTGTGGRSVKKKLKIF